MEKQQVNELLDKDDRSQIFGRGFATGVISFSLVTLPFLIAIIFITNTAYEIGLLLLGGLVWVIVVNISILLFYRSDREKRVKNVLIKMGLGAVGLGKVWCDMVRCGRAW